MFFKYIPLKSSLLEITAQILLIANLPPDKVDVKKKNLPHINRYYVLNEIEGKYHLHPSRLLNPCSTMKGEKRVFYRFRGHLQEDWRRRDYQQLNLSVSPTYNCHHPHCYHTIILTTISITFVLLFVFISSSPFLDQSHPTKIPLKPKIFSNLFQILPVKFLKSTIPQNP